MNVCFFAQYSKKYQNGATLSLINIATEMSKRGIHVTIIVPNKKAMLPINEKNITVINLPMFSMRTRRGDHSKLNKLKEVVKIIYNRVAVRKAFRVLKNDKPDIIHINGIDSSVGAEVANRLNVPYTWHIRQLLEEDFDMRLHDEKNIYNLLNKADSVIAISKTVQDKFEDILKRDIQLIYNGIPLEEYIIEEKKPLFANKTVNILLAGRIVEQKGQFDAVKAVGYLRKKGIKNIYLTIAGSIQDITYYKEMMIYIEKNNLNNNIKIIDHVIDLRELRKKCDIGLICSKKEAFGRVTIETMASRMLAIGANTGGTIEIIEDNVNGLLYDQGNYLSLAQKIKYAMNNKTKMNSIVEEGYRTAIERYSISKVVDQIMGLYNGLLEGN